MGKKSVETVQNQALGQFQKDVRSNEMRNWKNIIEESIENGKKNLKPKSEPAPRISLYNPNNPLNGSSSWSKEKWAEYKEKLKAEERAIKDAKRAEEKAIAKAEKEAAKAKEKAEKEAIKAAQKAAKSK